MAAKSGRVPCLLWPFWAIWRLITTIITLLGRVVAFVIGTILMVVGALLTMTVVGAVLGIPLAALGLALVVRSLF